MQLIILAPLVVCLFGLLIYLLGANPKTQEMGRLAYACGLLVTLFSVATKLIHF